MSEQSRTLDSQDGASLPRLVAVMKRLLGEGGCPWDREQTMASLTPFVIEEAHEVVSAIDGGDATELKEELGDLLLQVVFLAELARGKGWFGPDDVVAAIESKMVRRHPHVFGSESAETSEQVLAQWEANKDRERRAKKGTSEGALAGVPRTMPALLRAVRVGEKASRVGYDWEDVAGARGKIDEELGELDEAVRNGDRTRIEQELGDLLFAVASFARKGSLDPEAALRGTLDRFSKRFAEAERLAAARGTTLREMEPAGLDSLWREVKSRLG